MGARIDQSSIKSSTRGKGRSEWLSLVLLLILIWPPLASAESKVHSGQKEVNCLRSPYLGECLLEYRAQKRLSSINLEPRPLLSQNRTSEAATSVKNTSSAANTTQNKTKEDEEPEEELSAYERKRRNFSFFNRGFKGHEIARNFSNCGSTSIYWYYRET